LEEDIFQAFAIDLDIDHRLVELHCKIDLIRQKTPDRTMQICQDIVNRQYVPDLPVLEIQRNELSGQCRSLFTDLEEFIGGAS
jgi:hypothetical protein